MIPGVMFLAAVAAVSLVAVQNVRAGDTGNLLEASYAKRGSGAGLVLVVSLQRAH